MLHRAHATQSHSFHPLTIHSSICLQTHSHSTDQLLIPQAHAIILLHLSLPVPLWRWLGVKQVQPTNHLCMCMPLHVVSGVFVHMLLLRCVCVCVFSQGEGPQGTPAFSPRAAWDTVVLRCSPNQPFTHGCWCFQRGRWVGWGACCCGSAAVCWVLVAVFQVLMWTWKRTARIKCYVHVLKNKQKCKDTAKCKLLSLLLALSSHFCSRSLPIHHPVCFFSLSRFCSLSLPIHHPVCFFSLSRFCSLSLPIHHPVCFFSLSRFCSLSLPIHHPVCFFSLSRFCSLSLSPSTTQSVSSPSPVSALSLFPLSPNLFLFLFLWLSLSSSVSSLSVCLSVCVSVSVFCLFLPHVSFFPPSQSISLSPLSVLSTHCPSLPDTKSVLYPDSHSLEI